MPFLAHFLCIFVGLGYIIIWLACIHLLRSSLPPSLKINGGEASLWGFLIHHFLASLSGNATIIHIEWKIRCMYQWLGLFNCMNQAHAPPKYNLKSIKATKTITRIYLSVWKKSIKNMFISVKVATVASLTLISKL